MIPAYDDDELVLHDPPPSAVAGDEPQAEADGEIEWEDDPRAAPTVDFHRDAPEDLAQQEIDDQARRPARPVRPASRGPDVPRTTAVPPKRASRVKPPETEESPDVERRLVPLAERVQKHRNALIAMAVLMVIVATVAFRSWRSRWQELPRIAELGRVEGLPALDAGNFDRAHQLLAEAKRAVIALGDAYQGAEAIKQGADEAAIINRLLPNKLEELLDEAARSDPKEWVNRFETLYSGRSVIIDAHFTTTPDGVGEGRYELDYRILSEGEGGKPPRIGRIDTTGLRLITLIKPKVGDRLTFGARLASFRFDNDQWLVGLEPESGVIITHMKALEALGWPSAAEDSP